MTAISFRNVDRALLHAMLQEPAKASATCIVLQDTAASIQRRLLAGHYCSRQEERRTRVAAATALAAVRALRVSDVDVLRAADELALFLIGDRMTANAQVAA